jgi:thiol:disulfide interchange protein
MSFAQQSGRARQEIFQLNLWYCAGLYAVFFVLATASVAANLGLAGNNLAWGEQFTSSGFNITMAAIVFSFALSFPWGVGIAYTWFHRIDCRQSSDARGTGWFFFQGRAEYRAGNPMQRAVSRSCLWIYTHAANRRHLCCFRSHRNWYGTSLLHCRHIPFAHTGLSRSQDHGWKLLKKFWDLSCWALSSSCLLSWIVIISYLHLHCLSVSGLAAGGSDRYQKTKGMAGFMQWLQAAAVSVTLGTLVFSYLGPSDSVIDWEPFSKERLAELRSKGSTVMVDFSAEWCLTCKYNLAFAIETSRVKTAIEKRKVVPMLADWTDGSPEIKAMLESLNSKSIHCTCIFSTQRKKCEGKSTIILRDLVTESQVLDAIEKVELVRPPVPDMRSRTAG